MNITPTFRKFHLQRHEDASGVSGTGRVAEGIVFSDGTTVVRWLSACGSTNVYANSEAILQVHGHGGNTDIVWDDPAPSDGTGVKSEEAQTILDDPAARKKIMAVAEAAVKAATEEIATEEKEKKPRRRGKKAPASK